MRSRSGIAALAAALVVVLVLATGLAEAGRPRRGVVVSPFGPLYNTGSPEWRMAGGNPFVYEQIMEQKMLMRQQEMMLKQQQQLRRSANRKTGPGVRAERSPGAGPSRLAPDQKKKPRRTTAPTRPASP